MKTDTLVGYLGAAYLVWYSGSHVAGAVVAACFLVNMLLDWFERMETRR
jgi:hypothetical protein